MRNISVFFMLFVALLALAILPASTWAANMAGRVQFAIGDVWATNAAGNMRPLKKGDAIYEGDAVTTTTSSSAQIKMQDGGFIAIRPDSKLKFDQFIYNGKEDGDERGVFSLVKGGLRAITGAIGKTNKKNYKIETTVATIGIRGTDHEAYFVTNGSALAAAGVYSKVNVGETSLTTERGTVNVLPNQMAFAGSSNEVPKVVPVNTHLFTVTPTPTKTIKEQNEEQEKQKQSSETSQDSKKEDKKDSKQDGTQDSSQDKKQDNKQDSKQDAKQDGKQGNSPANSNAAQGDSHQDQTGSSPETASRQSGNSESGGNKIRGGDSGGLRVEAMDRTALAGFSSFGSEAGGLGLKGGGFGTKFDADTFKLIIPIILTNAATGSTLNATTQSNDSGGRSTNLTGAPILAVPYASNHTALQTTFLNTRGSLISLGGLSYVNGGSAFNGALSAYTENGIGGGSGWSYSASISGGTAYSYNAPSFALTGIQYGYWTGYTSQTYASTYSLGGKNNGSQNTWMYAPQGYIDSAYLSSAGSSILSSSAMYGTFTYSLDGANAPRYMNSGSTGTLTSATITANFASLTVSASLGLTMPGNDNWAATLSSQSFSVLSGGAFYGYTSSGSSSSNLTITHGVGTAATTCSTCSGNLNGMFTGQNFAGAIIAFMLSDSAQGTTVYGDAALSRLYSGNSNSTVSNNTAAPTGTIVIDSGYGSLYTYSSSSVSTSNNVLTQYGSSTSSLTKISCPNCTATASGQVSTSGIYYGTWTSGTYTSSYTTTYSSNSAMPAYWITGPEAGPIYLPEALIGTATFALDAGQMSNSMGTTGSVSGTSSLAVNFTKQVVGINLDATISGHSWNAKTVSGSEAPLTGGQGIAGATFHAFTNSTGTSSSNNYNGISGRLSVSVDGNTSSSNYATVDGQFTGAGLSGAIISFTLSGGSGTYYDYLNGVAAFSGTPQNINAPYRSVAISTYNSSSPLLGFWFNNPSRISQDASGNLTQFDTQPINSNGSSNNVVLSNSGSTLTDFGTDPVTGISWGRWAGGTLYATDRANGSVSTTALAGSLHWIAEPVATSPVTLPISGTYTYNYAGGTSPTDSLGNIGKLNSASLSANFTAQTVNLGVNATVNGTTMNATATDAPIIQRTVFYASSQEPSSSSSSLSVNCSGNCSSTTGGTVVGKFTGAGATGAAMSYGLQNGSTVISGVAAFHR